MIDSSRDEKPNTVIPLSKEIEEFCGGGISFCFTPCPTIASWRELSLMCVVDVCAVRIFFVICPKEYVCFFTNPSLLTSLDVF